MEVSEVSACTSKAFVHQPRVYRKLPFQDVAKAGLKFGDEGLSNFEEPLHDAEVSLKIQMPMTRKSNMNFCPKPSSRC